MRPSRYIIMITAPVLATGALLLVVGGVAAWYVHRLNREVSVLLARTIDCTVASERLVLGIRNARNQAVRFADTGDQATFLELLRIEQSNLQDLRDAEQSAPTDDMRELIGQARHGHEQFFAEFTAVTSELATATTREKTREMTSMLTDKVLAPAEELLLRLQNLAKTHSARSQTLADYVGRGLLLLGACGAVGGMMSGYGISRVVARQIEQSEHETARADQLAAVGQLAAGLAHEFRNPLTAIRVLVEAGGQQGGAAGLDRRDLEVLNEEIARLEKLVDSFLDFARPPQLEKTSIDARLLVEQTLHLVSGAARQRDVTIDLRQTAEPVMIEADPVQLRQVLLNLVLNAMDAAGESGTVTVELDKDAVGPDRHSTLDAGVRDGPAPQGRYHRVIHVSDSGPGIPDDMKERIFEPFVSTKETGMGLGLAVSRRIVAAHGGTIRVTDNPAGGARFTICLPSSDGPVACQ